MSNEFYIYLHNLQVSADKPAEVFVDGSKVYENNNTTTLSNEKITARSAQNQINITFKIASRNLNTVQKFDLSQGRHIRLAVNESNQLQILQRNDPDFGVVKQ
eukprot:GEZU01008580.1.p1 GENE.GEZU01008580.1~~GEZU01008580.1.p1  ORF type:complete len:103 (-),score=26.97 GEZU01008580.1:57-365(-)